MRFKILTVLLASFIFLSTGVSAATVSLSPTSLNPSKGSTGAINVTLNLGTENSYGADLYIVYDPSILEFTSIKPSNTVKSDEQINEIDAQNGVLKFSFLNLEVPYTGEINVATLNFNAKETGQSTVAVSTSGNNTTSWVADFGSGSQLLTSTVSSTVTVGSSSGSGDNGSSSGSGDNGGSSSSSSSSTSGSSSSSSSSSSTTTPVPETGKYDTTIFAIISSLVFGAGITIKKLFV